MSTGINDAEKEEQERFSTEKKKKKLDRFFGFFCALISAFAFSVSSVIVKVLTEVHPLQLCIVRSVGIMIPTGLTLLYKKRSPCPNEMHFTFFIRCAIGAIVLMLMYVSVRYLPLSDSAVIGFSTPVFVTVLAWLFLNESFSAFHGAAIFLSLSGIVLISRPPFLFGGHTYDSLDTIIGLTAACVGVLLKSGIYILTRMLKNIHLSVILFTYTIFSATLSTILLLFMGNFNISLSPIHWTYLVGVAVAGLVGQTLMTKALQIEEAAVVSIVRCSDIVFAFVWQYLFLNEEPNLISVLGAVLVSSSVILITLKKLLEKRIETE